MPSQDSAKESILLEVEKANGPNGIQSVESEHDKAMVRKILFKADTHILPLLALLFLCSFLDRTNIGNARLYGLEASLGITDHQTDSVLAIFYAFYILSEIPSNLALKKISPKLWLPCLTFVWGVVSMSGGFVKTYSALIGVRVLLGIVEGGLLPGIVLYLSTIYTREQMGIRIGFFYTAASLSGAFGGLLARGLSTLGYRGGQEPWRWIFIIEGLCTALIAICVSFILPNGLETARWLTPEQREFWARRKAATSNSNGETAAEKLQWSEVIRGLTSIQTYLCAFAYTGILSGIYSFGLFLPTIIHSLGYTADEAQLWSVIPYATASVTTVIVAYLSDRLHLRGPVMLCTLPIGIIGYAVISNTPPTRPMVKYGCTFLMATGLYSSVPPLLSWVSNNTGGHYKRATATATQLMIANCGGFIAVFIYPKTDEATGYKKGHSIVLGLLCLGWCLIAACSSVGWKINRDKARGKYDHYIGKVSKADDRHPEFKMVL